MHTEMNELMQRALQAELTAVETQRLQTHLHECRECSRDWELLTNIHRQLSSAPLLSPADGFAERVLNRIAVQQQQANRRPGTAPTLLFALGAVGLVLISLGPSLAELAQPETWVGLLNSLLSLLTTLSAWLGVAIAFARVILQLVGDGPLLMLALLALALIVFWARIVSGAPFRLSALSNIGVVNLSNHALW